MFPLVVTNLFSTFEFEWSAQWEAGSKGQEGDDVGVLNEGINDAQRNNFGTSLTNGSNMEPLMAMMMFRVLIRLVVVVVVVVL